MLRIAAAALALTAMASSGMAQTAAPSSAGQVTVPSGQNSGAGISGQPGNKNGPPAQSPTTGAGATSPPGDTVRQQDPAKIQGLPGNKSGPAAKPPSGATGR